MLERNRFPPIQISEGTTVAFTPSGALNTPLIFENLVLTSSIDIVNEDTSTGGSGGSLTKFNYVGNQFLQQSGVGAGSIGGINSTLVTGTNDITLATNVTNNLTGMGSLSVTSTKTLSSATPIFVVVITITSGTLVSVSSIGASGNFTVGESFTIAGSDINASFGGSLTVTITENLIIPPYAGVVGEASFGEIPISQSWNDNIATIAGLETFVRNEQSEFYNGEFSGSELTVTTQSLLDNPYLNPTIPITPTFIYSQSVYYPTVNNALENRPNTDRYVVENQSGVNTISNLQEILSGSAIKAQTPNSNYTTEKIIIPRYLGSKISSADYNFYTSASATVPFLDGTTGSWVGDNSYGNTAVIDKNPIYFAHFQSSRENLELFGTYTFDVDQLIEVPFEDITTKSLTIPPVTLLIDGSNQNLLTTSNVFEKTRGVTVSYENQTTVNDVSRVNNISTTPTVTSESLTTDYSTLNVGDNRIYQGGLEYLTISTTQPTPTTYLRSMSFDVGNNVEINTGSKSQFGTGELVGDEYITYLTSSRFADAYTAINTIEFGSTKWAETGSGYIDLLGGAAALDLNLFVNPSPSQEYKVEYYGSSLALMHTYNYWVKNQVRFSGLLFYPGLPAETVDGNLQLIPINPEDNSNYFRFNPTSTQPGANAFGYTDSDIPFLLQRGDEIRVTYNLLPSTVGLRTFAEQDFTVTEIDNISSTFADVYYSLDGTAAFEHG